MVVGQREPQFFSIHGSSLEKPVVLRVNRRLCPRPVKLSRSTKRVLIVVRVVDATSRALISSAAPKTLLRVTSTTRPFSRRLTTWAYNRFGRGLRRGAGYRPRSPGRSG
jgi:hypothetical protein